MSRRTEIGIWLLVFSGVFLLGGCGLGAWILTATTPEPIEEAVYELPENKAILVLVDDPKSLLIDTEVKRDLTEELNTHLTEQSQTEKTIPYRKLMYVKNAHPDFNQFSVAKIGKLAGADLVICVMVEAFSLGDDDTQQVIRGRFETTVKVISVEKGKLWPRDEIGGYKAKAIDTGQQSPDDLNAKRQMQKLARTMSLEMADNIAKLFYKHEGKKHGDLPDREPGNEP